jgi:hypothetical protein
METVEKYVLVCLIDFIQLGFWLPAQFAEKKMVPYRSDANCAKALRIVEFIGVLAEAETFSNTFRRLKRDGKFTSNPTA